AVGAGLGSSVHVEERQVVGDLRYGGACLGAWAGFFLLFRFFARLPLLAALGVIVAAIWLFYSLLDNNPKSGWATLVVLLSSFVLLWVKYKRPPHGMVRSP